jgi:Protein of unknown function (DUF2817)
VHCASRTLPNGAALSMDIAWFGDRSASKVFVAFSGVHGVEGFFGSGVQIEWIHRSENRRLPRDTAALLVHAVNPYGFAWLRRTNEDNVDLNRNWIDFDRPLPTNERYEEIAEDLCPPDGSADAQTVADARLASWREHHRSIWAASTWKQNLPRLPTAAAQIRVERLARLLGQFEPHRPPGFPLAHVGAVDCVALRRCVIDAQCHEIASAQFAVDRQVEEG